MIARYQIVRGKRQPGAPLPDGERQDTRKHTRHVLRPDSRMVADFLADPGHGGFERFRRDYLRLLKGRFRHEREHFDMLAERARTGAVFLGCNCPTARQPNVRHCHTWLALEFLAEHYPDLDVVFPPGIGE